MVDFSVQIISAFVEAVFVCMTKYSSMLSAGGRNQPTTYRKV